MRILIPDTYSHEKQHMESTGICKFMAREPGYLSRKLMISEAELTFYHCSLPISKTGSCALWSRSGSMSGGFVGLPR